MRGFRRWGRRRRRGSAEQGSPAGPAGQTANGPSSAQLMGRVELAVMGDRGRRLVTGRRVLVTGAAGTVGSAICEQVHRLSPAALCVVDRDAGALGRLRHELAGRAGSPPATGIAPADRVRVIAVRADVRDRAAVDRLLRDQRPELVFHSAGVGGVAPLEHDPCGGVIANVLGTHHLVDGAVRTGVRRLVLVSTDKAVDPASVFGATMRLAELVLQTAAGGPTRFAAVRVGDIIGRLAEPWRSLAPRIERGETVTLTHPEVARHFMTAGEAAGLVVESAALAEEAETFALDMGAPVPVIELVQRYAAQLRLPEVTIRFCGLGPGEKVAEKVFADGERRVPTAHPDVWGTRPAPPPAGLGELLDRLYAAADRGDDEAVRLLLRRLLPEYRPARRALPAARAGRRPAGRPVTLSHPESPAF